jgi:hypothetical protein
MAGGEHIYHLRESIEEELYPYGSYLAMRGAKEGEQRFGVPEITFAALAVFVWVLQQFFHAYIQEKGTQLAQRGDENQLKKLGTQIKVLQEELQSAKNWQDDMETKWTSLVQQLPPDFPLSILLEQTNSDELIQILLDFGLSERTARKASVAIRRHFEKAWLVKE